MKKKYKMGLAGFAAVVVVIVILARLFQSKEAETEIVAAGNLETVLTVQGTLVPRHSEIVNAGFNGAVKEIPNPAGTAVNQGDLILKMGYESQADLELQMEQYRQQLSSARQTYDRLFGKNGSAAAEVSTAQSSFHLAEKNYQNGKTLAATGDISQMELNVLADRYNQAKQALNQAVEQNSDSSRKYYQELITSYEKQLETLKQVVSPGEITMPYDGVIWELYHEEGQYVTANQPVAKIYQPGDMKITVSLLTEDAVQLTPGQTVSVQYADGTVANGTIRFISAVAGQSLSTIGMEENRCSVELEPENLPESAGAGQQVDVTYALVAAKQVLSVSSTAIVPVSEGDAVYVLRNGKAVLVEVETGKKSGGRVEIRSGLAAGDQVISDPYGDEVKAGSRVKNAG